MRLFIAIDFSEEYKEKIYFSYKFFRESSPKISWVKKENLHLTLKFLGGIKNSSGRSKESILQDLEEEIKKSLDGRGRFFINFDRIGYFDHGYLVIWLGIKSNKELTDLANILDHNMTKFGYPCEAREYTPHITLGRLKKWDVSIKESIKNTIRQQEISLPPFEVSEIKLVQSTLTSAGPIYTPLANFVLY